MKTLRHAANPTALSLALLMGALGCTSKTPAPDDTPVKTQVENTTPTGTVSGEVRDLGTGVALDGVDVFLLGVLVGGAPPAKVTTAADGMWTFANVPAGGVLGLILKKDGYHEARVSVTLAAAAGNFPSSNNSVFVGPVHLLRFGDTPLKVEVLRQDGTPAVGAPVFMDLPVAFFLFDGATLLARGDVHEMATLDMNGAAQFARLPDPKILATRFPLLKVTLTVGAVPATATDPGSEGVSRSVPLTDLIIAGTVQRFVLAPLGAATTLEVVAATLPDLVAGIRPQLPGSVLPGVSGQRDSYLRVVFNQPVALNSVVGTLVSETGEPLAGTGQVTRMAVWRPEDTADPMPLTGVGSVVDLLVPALSAGTEANLVLSASAARGTAVLTRAAPIYLRQDAALAVVGLHQTAVVTPDNLLGAGEAVDIILNQAVGGRHADGTAAAANEFQKVVVLLQQSPTNIRMECDINEPSPHAPYGLGGFTTRVHCTLPTPGTQSLGATTASSVRVDFNDAADRDGGSGRTGGVAAVTPDGTVVVTASGTPTLTLLPADH